MKYQLISYIKRLIIPILLYCLSVAATGQNGNLLNINSLNGSGNTNIKLLIDQQTKYIQNLYSEKVEAPKEIINGKEYESYYPRSKAKPLLFADKRRTATVFTRTRRYGNLTLQYDTFLDEVIYTDTSRTINYRFPQIALNKDIVDGFNLYFEDDSLKFRNLRLPECANVNLKEGFYEIAYKGKSEFVIKHASSFYVREGLNEYKYAPENYFSVGDVFHRVKDKRSFLKLFGEKYGAVKKYIHLNRIRIRQADKNQFVRILKFYDSLITSAK
jgi:hypothetical protein